MPTFEPYDDEALVALAAHDALQDTAAAADVAAAQRTVAGFEPGDREQGDLVMLAELRRDGIDLTVPLELGCFLDLPTLHGARAAAAELRLQGWQATIRPARDERTWEVQAERRTVVSHPRITAIGELMHALATRLGGAYDGWGVALP